MIRKTNNGEGDEMVYKFNNVNRVAMMEESMSDSSSLIQKEEESSFTGEHPSNNTNTMELNMSHQN